MEQNEISVLKKEVKVGRKTIFSHIINMGDDQYVTVKDAAALLGVTQSAVKKHLTRHGLTGGLVVPQSLQYLKNNKVIGLRARADQTLLLSRDTVKALVKLVKTPQAWEAYHELWDIVDHVVSGDYDKAAQAVGKSAEDFSKEIQALQDKMKYQPLKLVQNNAMRAKEVAAEFPEILEAAMDEFGHLGDSGFNPAAIVSIFLKANFPRTEPAIRETSSKGSRLLYDRAYIEGVACQLG